MTTSVFDKELFYFNGVNGATGDYSLPPMTGEELFQFIQGEAVQENLNELRYRYEQKDLKHLGVKEGVDSKKLEESGWGVIFAHDADPALKESLSPLLKLRQSQAGEHFKKYEGPQQKGGGVRPHESKNEFLTRNGVGPGPADPEKAPYYLIIVGNPEKISYRFQSQLDVQYAVGRIDFGNDLEAYDNYARSVVEAESDRVKLSRQVNFFGVGNIDDRATSLSSQYLVSPLAEYLRAKHSNWTINAFLKDQTFNRAFA